MYQKGISTRDFLERILGHSFSASTISHITDVVAEDIETWQRRPLQKRYSVFLDGTYLKLRRGDVANEVVYLVVGVTEDGHREILGFYVGGQESALGWKEILLDLYDRGVEEVLLGVFDGLPGLEEAMKSIYPKADVQRCVVHKVRNALNAVRKKDHSSVAEDLKFIYQANTHKEARVAAEKIVYLQSKDYNQRWSERKLRGFSTGFLRVCFWNDMGSGKNKVKSDFSARVSSVPARTFHPKY
jgi:putative transposase